MTVVAVGVVWWRGHLETIRLQSELDYLRDAHRELSALRAEHERLSSEQPDAARIAELHRESVERDRLLREIDVRKAAPQPPPFSLGEWVPSRAWQNRGRATPRAAIETTLWAAAGGDVASLESMLEFDAAALAKSSALLAALPPESRGVYSTPQALIAAYTTKNIPLAEAQIAWLHESDPDHAAVALFVSAPDGTSAPAPHEDSGAPPSLSDDGKSKLVTLSLHRTDGAWRLVVPAVAVDRIAREFTAKN